jgi:hypothetical protein
MNPYIFQVALAALLVLGATVGVTKFVMEITGNPVLSDEEWAARELSAEDVFEAEGPK